MIILPAVGSYLSAFLSLPFGLFSSSRLPLHNARFILASPPPEWAGLCLSSPLPGEDSRRESAWGLFAENLHTQPSTAGTQKVHKSSSLALFLICMYHKPRSSRSSAESVSYLSHAALQPGGVRSELASIWAIRDDISVRAFCM